MRRKSVLSAAAIAAPSLHPAATAIRRRAPLVADAEIRNASLGRHALGNNLFLVVTRGGIRQFTFRGRDGKGNDRVAKLGEYPAMSLAQARNMAAAERLARYEGTTTLRPSNKGKQRGKMRPDVAHLGTPLHGDVQAYTFGDWCAAYFGTLHYEKHWAPATMEQHIGFRERYLAPSPLWHTVMRHVEIVDVAKLVDAIYKGQHLSQRGIGTPHTAKKVKSLVGYIFRYAIGKGAKGLTDPTPFVVVGSGRRNKHKVSLPSVVEINRAAKVINDFMALPLISQSVRNAAFLQAFTLHRTDVISKAEWSEFDLDAKTPTWTVPRHKMKMTDPARGDFIQPLDAEIVTFLKALPRTHRRWVFPGRSGDAPLALDALTRVYRDVLGLRGQMVPHGWRSVFATWAHRINGDGLPLHDVRNVEWVLDHEPRSRLVRAYDRAATMARAAAMVGPLRDYRAVLRRAMAGEVIESPTLDMMGV